MQKRPMCPPGASFNKSSLLTDCSVMPEKRDLVVYDFAIIWIHKFCVIQGKDQNFHWDHTIHKHGPEVDIIMFKVCSSEATSKYKISYQGCFWKLVSHRCLRCRWCTVPYAGYAFGSSSYPYRHAYAERRKPRDQKYASKTVHAGKAQHFKSVWQ